MYMHFHKHNMNIALCMQTLHIYQQLNERVTTDGHRLIDLYNCNNASTFTIPRPWSLARLAVWHMHEWSPSPFPLTLSRNHCVLQHLARGCAGGPLTSVDHQIC